MKKIFIPKWFQNYLDIYQEKGLKVLIKEKGWRLFFLVFIIYLIKGLFWLAIPYLITKGFFA